MSRRLPWHDEQWARLIALKARGRMPHALLLRGAAGVGKRRFSRRLAGALLCRSPSSDEACGRCRACHLAAAGHHPDQHLVGTPEDRKTIGIDQIRELIGHVGLTAGGGAYKVVVIAPAERMTHPAANTLLKTLEEPPGDTVFMLVSDQSSLLPPTIRSRCQAILFPCPPRPVALSWLEDETDAGQPVSALLALAHGAPLRAAELAGGKALECRAALLGDLASLFRGSADPVSVAERWSEYGIDQVSWWLTGIVQDAIRVRAAPGFPAAPHGLDALAREAALDDWFRLLDGCLAARGALARQLNLNERLVLEGLVLACRRTVCDDGSVPLK